MVVSDEIGRVEWSDQGRSMVAILRTDITWDVPDSPGLTEHLNIEYSYPGWESGPEHGLPGDRELHDWARKVGGTVTLQPRKSTAPPGTIY